MKYFIITYGCQMNHSDSEKIASQLQNSGHTSAKTAATADLIVLNVCSVRQSAVHRALDQIHKLTKPAFANSSINKKKVIVAGCVLPADRKKLEAKGITVWLPGDYFFRTPLRQNKISSFVPIMTGCNNFCSYCVVPFTRGREKSRPAATILAEIKQLLKNGAKEIILLGQNVNSYQSPSAGRRTPNVDFPSLLQKINDLPGNFWLSFISSHPKDISDKLLNVFTKCQKIIPYVHLPVQSGDNKVLRAMNRNYNISHYKHLVKKIRLAFKKRPAASAFPPVAISTDIIVGFPGETAAQFKNTLKLIQDINFDMIYFARYSPRPGTAAAKIKDNLLSREKRRRAQTVNSLLKKQVLNINKKYINQKIDVLIEKVEKQFAFGKTNTNKQIRLPRQNLKIGQFATVKVTGATAWGLTGKYETKPYA